MYISLRAACCAKPNQTWVNEISKDVDEAPHAYYFQQALNGLYTREALISYAMGYNLDDIRNDKTIID